MPKNFKRHDNIDYEVVEVNKSTLLLKFNEIAENSTLSNETLTYFSMALSFYAAVFFTESTRGLWTISGETIEAAFLVGGIACTIAAIHKGIKWYQTKNKFSPESLIKTLISETDEKPIALLPAPKTLPTTMRKPSVKGRKTVTK